jgi:molybdopterin-synthase adenylyltransferase
MSGQVILSMPGAACMECLGFLNALTLTREAGKYGDAGIRAQVVWANGTLASAAVGIAVDLVTGWTGACRAPVYLEYDGNAHTLTPHKRLSHVPPACNHYPSDDVEHLGDPIFRAV